MGEQAQVKAHPTPVSQQERLSRAALIFPCRCLGKSGLRLEPEAEAVCQVEHAQCLCRGPNVVAQAVTMMKGSEKALACPQVPFRNI